jgi:hypothetical protein
MTALLRPFHRRRQQQIFITVFTINVLFGITYSNIFNLTCEAEQNNSSSATQLRRHSSVIQR